MLKDANLIAIVPGNHALAAEMGAFAASVPSSHWWSAVSAEYGLGAMTTATHSTPAWTGAFDDTSVGNYLQAAITAGTIPGPNGHNLYLLFVPDVVTGQCMGNLGYHDTWPQGGSSAGDVLAVVEWCPPDPLVPMQADDLTWTATHEIAEGSTNPQFGSNPAWVMAQVTKMPWTSSPWWAVPAGEIGDMCDSSFTLEGGFLYERVWSVSAAAAGGDPCIPSVAGAFYDVSNGTMPSWLTAQPGATLDVPLVGWSTAASPPWWQVSTYVTNSSSGFSGAMVTVTSPRSGWFGSCRASAHRRQRRAGRHHHVARHGAGDGEVGRLGRRRARQLSRGRPRLQRRRAAATRRHYWYVGVYVP